MKITRTKFGLNPPSLKFSSCLLSVAFLTGMAGASQAQVNDPPQVTIIEPAQQESDVARRAEEQATTDGLPRALLQRGSEPKSLIDDEDPAKAVSDPRRAGAPARDESCRPQDRVCSYELAIQYVVGRIRNPRFPDETSGGVNHGWDTVKLRGYVGWAEPDAEDASSPAVRSDRLDGQATREGAAPSPSFMAPVISLRPGSTLRLALYNMLAKPEEMALPWQQAPCAATAPTHNDPHCANFNLTNMHFHGGWVSPNGNSDNVLLTLNPGVKFTYEYNIPEDHPAGTFWYHSHRHGSTAAQVSSGMAGVLLIRGDRAPRLVVNAQDQHAAEAAHGAHQGEDAQSGARRWIRGDIDVLLPRPRDQIEAEGGPQAEPEAKAQAGTAAQQGPTFREHVFMFQQIAYACRHSEDDEGTPANEKGLILTETGGLWACDPSPEDEYLNESLTKTPDRIGDIDVRRIGTVEPGPTNAFDQLGGRAWDASGRQVAINGEVQKQLPDMTTGEVQRWRLIGAGVGQTIKLQIRKSLVDGRSERRSDQRAQMADEICNMNELVEVVSIATDGLTRPRLQPQTGTFLYPGNREDILVTFGEAGEYCLVNAGIDADENISAEASNPAVLGFVTVKGADFPEKDASERIRQALKESAEAVFSNPADKKGVLDDLDEGLLSAFVWHQSIPDQDVQSLQTLAFNLESNRFTIGEIALLSERRVEFGQNEHSPLPKIAYETPPLDTLVLPLKMAEGSNHAYDPDRIDRILPLGGTEEWLLISTGNAPVHPFHIHVNPFEIVGVWKYEEGDENPSTWKDVSLPGSGSIYAGLKGAWRDTIAVQTDHLVKIRTRYERYIGDFVLHCHILDHEDRGMMQNVRIALPDGRGGVESHGH